MENRKKDFFEVNNLGIILIDFIPYENKENMVEEIKNLLGYKDMVITEITEENYIEKFSLKFAFDAIPDFRKAKIPISSADSWVKIGVIWNSDDEKEGDNSGRILRDIPKMFSHIEISVGQYVDFAYIITYCGYLKKEFYNDIEIEKNFLKENEKTKLIKFKEEKTEDSTRDWFIRLSKMGREYNIEPNLKGYQLELENFFNKYKYGIFLNTESTKEGLPCPSIKILSTKEIPFDNFEEWRNKHREFLDFLDLNNWFTYSKFKSKPYLLGFQKPLPNLSPDDSNYIFGEQKFQLTAYQELFPGLTILCSNEELKNEYLVGDLLNKTQKLFAVLFLAVYWPYYQMVINQKSWENKIEVINQETIKLKLLSEVQELHKKIIFDYKNFELFYLTESNNIDIFKSITKILEKNEAEFIAFVRKDSTEKDTSIQFNENKLNKQENTHLGEIKIISTFLYPLHTDTNIIIDFINRNEYLLSQEKIKNEYLKSYFISISNYIKYFSDAKLNETNINLIENNIKLQKGVYVLTVLLSILTLILVINDVQFLKDVLSRIWILRNILWAHI